MAPINIQIKYNCENCRFADEYGNNCKHGLLFPVLLLMNRMETCPNWECLTKRQLEERAEQSRENKHN